MIWGGQCRTGWTHWKISWKAGEASAIDEADDSKTDSRECLIGGLAFVLETL